MASCRSDLIFAVTYFMKWLIFEMTDFEVTHFESTPFSMCDFFEVTHFSKCHFFEVTHWSDIFSKWPLSKWLILEVAHFSKCYFSEVTHFPKCHFFEVTRLRIDPFFQVAHCWKFDLFSKLSNSKWPIFPSLSPPKWPIFDLVGFEWLIFRSDLSKWPFFPSDHDFLKKYFFIPKYCANELNHITVRSFSKANHSEFFFRNERNYCPNGSSEVFEDFHRLIRQSFTSVELMGEKTCQIEPNCPIAQINVKTPKSSKSGKFSFLTF